MDDSLRLHTESLREHSPNVIDTLNVRWALKPVRSYVEKLSVILILHYAKNLTKKKTCKDEKEVSQSFSKKERKAKVLVCTWQKRFWLKPKCE